MIKESIEINIKWLEGKAKFQDARNVAGQIFTIARGEKAPIKATILRIMGQIAATPHVARHALIASDYVIKLINLLYPNNSEERKFEEIKKERKTQIELIKMV
jgi:hypothetical protein